MSGMLSKSQVPTVGRGSLPVDVQAAIVNLKNGLRGASQNFPRTFNNRKEFANVTGQPLPKPSLGCSYVEFDVGCGRLDRGKRRLVAEVVESTGQIREIYFSDEHYRKGSFVRIT
jgi:guanyl-specific ribonuclease Sa